MLVSYASDVAVGSTEYASASIVNGAPLNMPRNSDGDARPAPPVGVDCVDSDLGAELEYAKTTALTLLKSASAGGLSCCPPGGDVTPKSPFMTDTAPGDAVLSHSCVLGL